jgi:hypothetical protein
MAVRGISDAPGTSCSSIMDSIESAVVEGCCITRVDLEVYCQGHAKIS